MKRQDFARLCPLWSIAHPGGGVTLGLPRLKRVIRLTGAEAALVEEVLRQTRTRPIESQALPASVIELDCAARTAQRGPRGRRKGARK